MLATPRDWKAPFEDGPLATVAAGSGSSQAALPPIPARESAPCVQPGPLPAPAIKLAGQGHSRTGNRPAQGRSVIPEAKANALIAASVELSSDAIQHTCTT